MHRRRKRQTRYDRLVIDAAQVIENLEQEGGPGGSSNARSAKFYRRLAALAGQKAADYAKRGRVTEQVRLSALAVVVRAIWSYCDLTMDSLADVVRDLQTADNIGYRNARRAAAAIALAEAECKAQSGKAA